VIDHTTGASHLSLFALNDLGELSAGTSIDLGAANANGVAILSPSAADDD
jgi:hypothetical protein